MNEQLHLALIQLDLVWEHPEQNRQNINKKISQLTQLADVIVLPEMFTSGFTMNPSRVAETMKGNTINWMHNIAQETQAAICGSLVIEENNNYYNRFVFVQPDGTLHEYNKRHTFTLAGEHKVYKAGTEKVIIDYKRWKICPMVCYDLRFPVWSRNVEDYDVLLYVANWPKPRIAAWDTLLKARAIENMSYCIGVNRIGFDANKNEYSGHSAVYDVLGEAMVYLPNGKEETAVVTLSKDHLQSVRSKLKFLDDRDQFNLLTT